MAQQSITLGATNFSYFNQNNGANINSAVTTNTTTAHTSGAFISGAFTTLRPIMIRTVAITWFNSSGTVRYKLANTKTGTDVWTSGNISASAPSSSNVSISSTSNYPTFTPTTLRYGFRKQDTGTTRVRRGDTANLMYISNPAGDQNGPIRGTITWWTVANAPTSFASISKTSTSVTFSWVKPTDLGGPTTLTGYRILYKESSSSTWLTSDKFGDDSTTSATIDSLTPNTEYNFRVAATNFVTDTHSADYAAVDAHTGDNSTELTVSTSGDSKLWNGSSFVPAITSIWDGSAFVPGATNVWNGTSWVRAGS
jgi:hypothetical protein